MAKIVIVQSDGKVAIMTTVGDADPATEVAKWQTAQDGITAVSWHPIDEADIPQDRSRRDKWRFRGNRLIVEQ